LKLKVKMNFQRFLKRIKLKPKEEPAKVSENKKRLKKKP